MKRLNALTCILALTFGVAHKVGEWRHQWEPIKIKKHGRAQKSYFRHGFDWMRDKITNVYVQAEELASGLANALEIDRFKWADSECRS